jgi:4-diphosphocytidyl-2-C-methyl-D-erythritol kinase
VREVRLRAYAKVNYALDVVGVRADGLHEIRSVMQSVSLADGVEIREIRHAGKGFELRLDPPHADVGPPEENTAYRAWRLLCDRLGEDLPVRVTLRKATPPGAGLGGGSSDAAAVLRGLDGLFGLGLPEGELRDVGEGVGADVPFCVSGGTALGEGVGEVLSPAPAPPNHRLLVVKPRRGADTGSVYRAHDRAPARGHASGRVLAALRSGDLAGLAGALGNDLAPVTKAMVPEVADLERGLLEAGALGAAMTGSGTAVYGLFADEDAAARAGQSIDAPFVGVCAPVPRGSEEV